jgi:hypothetical protein
VLSTAVDDKVTVGIGKTKRDVAAADCNLAGAYTRSHFSSTGALLSIASPNLTRDCVLELLKLSSVCPGVAQVKL